MGGMIAKVLSTVRASRKGVPKLDVKADPGGGGNITFEQVSPAGEDSVPLPGDYLGGVSTQGTGRSFASGYNDARNVGIAESGEVRRYARDAAGAPVSSVHLFRDGSIELVSETGESGLTLAADGSLEGFNASGSFKLEVSGDFTANGATITAAGEVINKLGIVLGTHVHVGSPTAPLGGVSPTGTPVP